MLFQPLVGESLRSSFFTSAAKPSWPLWKSTGFVATMIRTRFDGKIMREQNVETLGTQRRIKTVSTTLTLLHNFRNYLIIYPTY